MNLKGALPMLILQVLREGPKHGYRIAAEIRHASEGVLEFREGTLYPALHAHENHGLVESHEEIENGRRRRYYRLTEDGLKVLESERTEWRSVVSAVNVILGEA
jgi:PadR family transcriptional regulator PadR